MALTSSELALVIGCSVAGVVVIGILVLLCLFCISRSRTRPVRHNLLGSDSSPPPSFYTPSSVEKVGHRPQHYLPAHLVSPSLGHKDSSPCSSLVFPSISKFGFTRPAPWSTYLPPPSSVRSSPDGLQAGAAALHGRVNDDWRGAGVHNKAFWKGPGAQSMIDGETGGYEAIGERGRDGLYGPKSRFGEKLHNLPVTSHRNVVTQQHVLQPSYTAASSAGGFASYVEDLGHGAGQRSSQMENSSSSSDPFVARAFVAVGGQSNRQMESGVEQNRTARVYSDYGSQTQLLASETPISNDYVIDSRDRPAGRGSSPNAFHASNQRPGRHQIIQPGRVDDTTQGIGLQNGRRLEVNEIVAGVIHQRRVENTYMLPTSEAAHVTSPAAPNAAELTANFRPGSNQVNAMQRHINPSEAMTYPTGEDHLRYSLNVYEEFETRLPAQQGRYAEAERHVVPPPAAPPLDPHWQSNNVRVVQAEVQRRSDGPARLPTARNMPPSNDDKQLIGDVFKFLDDFED